MSAKLDEFPNFAMDTSGPVRSASLATQDNDAVRAFLGSCAERIMFGTDMGNDKMLSQYTPADQAAQLELMRMRYTNTPKYYNSTDEVTILTVTSEGLGLDDELLEKLFATNVRKWYPHLPADWC